jgi:hypothetical protein
VVVGQLLKVEVYNKLTAARHRTQQSRYNLPVRSKCVVSSAPTTTRVTLPLSDHDVSPCPRRFDTEDRIGVELMLERKLSCVTSDWLSSVLVSVLFRLE